MKWHKNLKRKSVHLQKEIYALCTLEGSHLLADNQTVCS